MASIPEHIVERVKGEANIVDVVSDYVQLRRTGKNWIGRCPFHDDSKPSMAVEPVRGIFKCFACGKGGNVFTFLMELNGWSFPETVRNLAATLHIDIPEDNHDRQEYSQRERLLAATEQAALFYNQTLYSDDGSAALAYLRKREFNDDTVKTFRLGYAPDDWESLLRHLSSYDFTPEELELAGLTLKREGRTSYYDRFRNRTMFPVFSATGRVLGFGARRMNEDPDQPKYINTPESPVYQKSRVLYGLFQAKDAIRKSGQAVVVEGYADVVSLHQAGVQTAIATCGTAMTTEHADLLKRYTQRVVLVFDSDNAGKAATDRGIDVLLRAGLDAFVLRLPDGEDPDTFVRKFGPKEFEGRVRQAVSFLEFRVRSLRDAGDLGAPDRAATAIRSVAASIALIPDALKRELVAQQLISQFSLPERLIMQELEQALGRNARDSRRRQNRAFNSQPESPQQAPPHPADAADQADGQATAAADVNSEPGSALPPPQTDDIPQTLSPEDSATPPVLRRSVTRAELPPEELGLLSVLVHGDPQLLEDVFTRVEREDFSHPAARDLVELIFSHYAHHKPFALHNIVMEDIAPEMRDLLTLLAIERESISDYWGRIDPELDEPNPWRIARDCLVRIEHRKIEHAYRAEQERLAQDDLSDDDAAAVFTRLKELGDRRHELTELMK